MSNPSPAPESPSSLPTPEVQDEKLRGGWLLCVRVAWFVVLSATLTVFIGGLPVYLARLETLCSPTAASVCDYQQLTAAQVNVFQSHGLSLEGYVALTLSLALAAALVAVAVSTLIIWRKSDNRMAALVAMVLMTPAIGNTSSLVGGAHSPWSGPSVLCLTLGSAGLVAAFLVFPNGRFAPRWMRWVAILYFAVLGVDTFVPYGTLIQGVRPYIVHWLVTLAGFFLAAIVQVYRYLRVSTPLQRQQTKWVALGFALPIAIEVLGSIAYFISGIAASGWVYTLFFNEMGFLLAFGVPLGFGVAILRSRLWGIDAIINRALVYGSLTGILGALYLGLIIGLQTLLRPIISQDNSITIVVSTLLIAAIANPLRRAIQAVIDRRFYRHKYDAAKALASFTAAVRQEVDLAQLNQHLTTVVRETMQPAHISLWLNRTPMPHLQPSAPDVTHESGQRL